MVLFLFGQVTFDSCRDYSFMRRSLTLLAILLATTTFAQSNCSYDSLTHIETCLFENGNISSTCEWRDPGRAHDFHLVHYSYKGYKTSEHSERYGIPYNTTRYWDDGILELLEIYSDTGYVSFTYDSTGLIRERGEYILPMEFTNSMQLVDSLNETRYHSNAIGYGTFVPSGIWTTYHANGKLESIGQYLPYTFIGTQHDSDTLKYAVECHPAGTILLYTITTETKLRNGLWQYYDETGKEIREEYYEGGILRNTIYH